MCCILYYLLFLISFLFLFIPFFFYFGVFIMSLESKDTEFTQNSQLEEEAAAVNTLSLVVEEVNTLFRMTKVSLVDCCIKVEGATH